uniref:hypothetical protein n=1 Tax=Prevotella sp. TaxID=59823 RepID=UPI004027D227
MKKSIAFVMCAVLTVTGCGTYAGSGAYTGASLGSILGSAIGGISGGPRGSDVGTIVGMAAGAVIGGAIGNQADQQNQADYDQYQRDKADRAARRHNQKNNAYDNQGAYSSQGGYCPQSNGQTNNGYNGQPGDDRITFDEGNGEYGSKDSEADVYNFHSSDYTGSYTAQQPTTSLPATSSVEQLTEGMTYMPHIEIRNARVVDDNQDKVISRGELCKVIFEIYNTGQRPLYDIQPSVVEATGNKQIFISPGMHVERLMPGAGIRYTAMLKAGPRLGDGSVRICLSVLQGDNAISKVTEFEVPTSKKKVQTAK